LIFPDAALTHTLMFSQPAAYATLMPRLFIDGCYYDTLLPFIFYVLYDDI